MLVAFVFLVDRDRGIAQHRLRTGRGHGDELIRANHGIANLEQLALDLFVLDLEIGNRRLAPRTPVDDVLAAINQSFFIQADENLAHGAGKPVVHGEVFAVPIDRRAQPLHLVENRAAVVLLPFPDALDERLAPQIAALLAFRRQLPLHHHLGSDAGVVGAGQPQRQKSAHAMPAHDDVHLRLVEHVAHVQAPGNVRRRKQQREHRPRLSRRRRGHGKKLLRDPVLGPARFNRARLVRFRQFVRHGL